MTNTYSEVEILDFKEDELWFEKTYKYNAFQKFSNCLSKIFCSYKCKTFGKSFLNSTVFIEHTPVTCQADKTWSLSQFPHQCECKKKYLQIRFTKLICVIF